MLKNNIIAPLVKSALAIMLLTVFMTPRELLAAEPALKSWTSQGGIFSVSVPQNWQRSEDFYFHEGGEYGLKLWAPGARDLSYVLIEFVCQDAEYKTAEKFIYEKLHPHMSPKNEERSSVADALISGKQAKTFTVKTGRFPLPGQDTAEVKIMRKYVVFPFSSGFGFALYEAPLDLAIKYESIFDKMVLSFKPLQQNVRSQDDDGIEDEEYTVFTDFLQIENKQITAAKEATLSPEEKNYRRLLKNFDLPALGDAFIVISQTTANSRKLDKKLTGALGITNEAIIADYAIKNQKTYKLKDKFLVQKNIAILTEEKARNMFSSRGGFAEFHKKYPFASGIIYFSRIGFNKERTQAVFYVANPVDSEMGRGYIVLMEKNKSGWILVNFINLWIS